MFFTSKSSCCNINISFNVINRCFSWIIYHFLNVFFLNDLFCFQVEFILNNVYNLQIYVLFTKQFFMSFTVLLSPFSSLKQLYFFGLNATNSVIIFPPNLSLIQLLFTFFR